MKLTNQREHTRPIEPASGSGPVAVLGRLAVCLWPNQGYAKVTLTGGTQPPLFNLLGKVLTGRHR